MTSFYLAGVFEQREKLRPMRSDLLVLGHEVYASWMDSTDTGFGNEAAALLDLEEIQKAVVFLHFTQDPNSLWPRGGRHFETGYAYGTGSTIILCGPKENIFHHLPGILQFPTWSKTLSFITGAYPLANDSNT